MSASKSAIESVAIGSKTPLPGDRLLRLRFRIRRDELVVAMEHGLVIDDTTPAKRGQVMELDAEFVIGRNRRALIVAPFRVDAGEPARTTPAINGAILHPIHRATCWHKEIAAGSGARAVARVKKISPSLVSLHLKLLKLAPEIQGFLRDLAAPKAIQHFSLRKLAALAKRPLEKQLADFAALRSGLG